MNEASMCTCFDAMLDAAAPPPAWPAPLRSMWWDAKGDWEQAHAVAALDDVGAVAAWVHAYLHRKEGDAPNAAYWYRRAGRPVATCSLEDEQTEIVTHVLADAETV